MRSFTRSIQVSPTQLRHEGVEEIGRVDSTALLYVRTKRGIHLLHIELIAERKLDAYGHQRMFDMLDGGMPITKVSAYLGISQKAISRELVAIGYVLKSTQDGKPRLGAGERCGQHRRRARAS